MDKEKLFPENKTSVMSLMNHPSENDLNLRIFNSITGSSIIGVVLEESHDSFLVALPSRLLANKEQRLIEPHMPVKYARLMKGAVISVIPCYGEFEVFYIQYLLTEGKAQYPQLLSEHFEQKLQGRFEQIRETLAVKEEIPKEEPPSESIVIPPGSNRYRH